MFLINLFLSFFSSRKFIRVYSATWKLIVENGLLHNYWSLDDFHQVSIDLERISSLVYGITLIFLLVLDNRSPNSPKSYQSSMIDDSNVFFFFLFSENVDRISLVLVSEMLNVNDGSNSQSRLIEQAVVTFFRDCSQRGKSIEKFPTRFRTNAEENEEELAKKYVFSRKLHRRWNNYCEKWSLGISSFRGTLKRKLMEHH